MSAQKFSLTRFSLNQEATAEISLSLSVAEKLGCTIKAISDIVITAIYAESLHGSMRATPSFYEQMQVEESLFSNVSGEIAANLGRIVLEEVLQSNINLAANVQLKQAMEDNLDCNVYLSNNMQFGMDASDALESKIALVADIPSRAILTETLNCDVSVINLTREVVQMNVTIPAGGKLIIDTDLYTATLNDDNVIDLHSGDWPWLTRDLVEIDIDSGTGGALTGKVIYAERYL